MFREKLNKYMELLHCSGKEFAEYSGISDTDPVQEHQRQIRKI